MNAGHAEAVARARMQQRQAKPVNTRPLDENGSLFGALERSADGLTTRPIQAGQLDPIVAIIWNVLQWLANFSIVGDVSTLASAKSSIIDRGLALFNLFPAGKILKGPELLVEIAKGFEHAAELLRKAGLNPAQIEKFYDFLKKQSRNFKKPKKVNVYNLPNEGKLFETYQDSNIPGSITIWEKYVDKEAETYVFGHRTLSPEGNFMHWHEKFPLDGLSLRDELDYKTRIEQIMKYYKENSHE